MRLLNKILLGFFLCSASNLLAQQGDSLAVYPNPFIDSATIYISLNEQDSASLLVFDLTGRLVRTVFNDTVLDSGEYLFSFDGKGLKEGIYLFNFKFGSKRLTQKVVKSGTSSLVVNLGLKKDFILYPNPATDYLTIPIEGYKMVSIKDLTGKELKALTTFATQIRVDDLPNGVYSLEIRLEKEMLFERFTVVKH